MPRRLIKFGRKSVPDENRQRDLARRPLSFLIRWGLPIAIIFSTNFAGAYLPIEAIITVIAAMFAWMGAGCIINAMRCRRLHCYLAGPVLLAGAIATVLVGFEIMPLGPDGLIYVVWGTLVLVGLTFVPEFIWGTYLPSKKST